MNCYTFEQILHDLDRPGTAGSGLHEAALAHAESCTSCARLLTQAEALDFELRALAKHDASKQAPHRVEAALLREFRAHHATGPHPAHLTKQKFLAWFLGGRSFSSDINRATSDLASAPQAEPSFAVLANGTARKRMLGWYASVVGVAATALLALGVARFHIGSVPVQPPRTTVVAANSTASNSAAVSQSAPGEPSAQANPTNSAEPASSEEATEFYPLPYADDSASLEGGAVIRVAMPRSTLASWGFPVTGVAGTDRIPAELVVSADGTPQAIRLLAAND